jgi:Uma2 family endonuclease
MIATARRSPRRLRTLADKLARLGDVSPNRIRLHPAPGTATEADLLVAMARDDTIYELVDGTLVEKGLGYEESCLAGAICEALRAFVRPRRLGKVSGADGTMRLMPGLVRVPDVAFTSWGRFPGRRMPKAPVPNLVPDLAVEVLSQSNTPAEMKRKREEYLRMGVRLVWIVDPKTRTVEVYAPRRKPVVLTESDTLDGGKVLPGFTLPLADLFAELDEEAPS